MESNPVPILHSILKEPYINHFLLLVVGMHILTCRVDMDTNRFNTLQKRENLVKKWRPTFVNGETELYTAGFAVYNTHNLIHLANDCI